MRHFGQTTAIAALSAALCATAAQARTILVGRAPYPTLADAVAAVPATRAAAPDEPVEIVLPADASRVVATVVIDAAHGGTARSPLIIRGAGRARLLGSVPVPARPARADDAPGVTLPAGTVALDLSRVPGTVDLDRRGPHGDPPPNSVQLFGSAGWLPPSRWPASGWANGAALGSNAAGPVVALPATLARAFTAEPRLWAVGYWGADWEYERVPVHAVADGALRLEPLRAEQPVRKTVRFRVENAISALSPGHAVLLPVRKLALAIPAAGRGGFEVTVAPTLLRLDGAAHVRVLGLDLERSGGDAVQVADASDVRIEDCIVRDAGGTGIAVTGGDGVVIRRTLVAGTGERGVVLSGGSRATLASSHHAFLDGMVADFGRLSPDYRPGIDLEGVGNLLSGSVIAGGDHAGVLVSGNDNRVVDNEVRDVLRDADDSGAIYMGADWSQRGNVVSGNYIHALGDPHRTTMFLVGVYLDDQFSGAEITGNVIAGGEFGVVIGGGRDNHVAGNLFSAPRRGGIYLDARGLTDQHSRVPEFTKKLQAMPFTSPAWRTRYPALAALPPARYGEPGGTVIENNRLVRATGSTVPLLDAPPAALRFAGGGGNRVVQAASITAGDPLQRVRRKRVPDLQARVGAALR